MQLRQKQGILSPCKSEPAESMLHLDDRHQ
jgi:hypothetical protein